MKRIHTKKIQIITKIMDDNEKLKDHLVVDVDRTVVDKYNEFLRLKLQEEIEEDKE